MKGVAFLVASSLLAVAFSVHALPRRHFDVVSPTRSFSLAERWYSVGKRSEAGSLLREEMRKRGLTSPKLFQELAAAEGSIVDVLTEIPPRMRARPVPLPSGFRMEDILQMESGDGSIEIAGGKISLKGDHARKALAAAGWELTETETANRSFCVGMLRKGRETTIVFLEEKEGAWLFLRRRDK